MTTFNPRAIDRYFSTRYQDARNSWLADAARLQPVLQQGWNETSLSSVSHPLCGPDQEALATDLLWLGSKQASRVVVIISGTHGIEGYVGNAVQRFLLQTLANSTRPTNGDLGFLLVHAINPWGMAWKRRCDENGVDLNRNYLDFSVAPNNQAYQQLQHCLTLADKTQRNAALLQHASSLGQKAYEIALSGGQYNDPDGPFYGGNSPAHGRLVCEHIVNEFSLPGKQLVVIDIHTGLGAWGYGEMISDHPLDHNLENPNDSFAQALFGPGITNPARGDSSSVAKFGLQDYFWHQFMDSKGCYITLEFGSYSVQALFDVIIDDHRLWKQYKSHSNGKILSADPLPPDIDQHQSAMFEHFCPQDKYWRQLVLFQAKQICERLLTHFGHCNAP